MEWSEKYCAATKMRSILVFDSNFPILDILRQAHQRQYLVSSMIQNPMARLHQRPHRPILGWKPGIICGRSSGANCPGTMSRNDVCPCLTGALSGHRSAFVNLGGVGEAIPVPTLWGVSEWLEHSQLGWLGRCLGFTCWP